MKKLIIRTLVTATLVFSLSASAIAASLGSDLEYYSSNENSGVFASSTVTDMPISQVGVVTTEDRVDKNAAVAPPPYGIWGGYIDTDYNNPYYDNYSTPGTSWGGNSSNNDIWDIINNNNGTNNNSSPSYTPAAPAQTETLYNADGSMGSISIPALGIWSKVYEGTSNSNMSKGLGHFEGTSAWDGNVCIAGHNRGSSAVVLTGIWNLSMGDAIQYTTPYGTRNYEVKSVTKTLYTDTSCLEESGTNRLTIVTCVMNEAALYRWVVVAEQVG